MVKDCTLTALKYAGHSVFKSPPDVGSMPEDVDIAIDMWAVILRTSCAEALGLDQMVGPVHPRSNNHLIEVLRID